MAIKLETKHGDTGFSGDHWALCDLQIRVGKEAGTTDVVVRYGCFPSAAAKAAGIVPFQRGRKFMVTVAGTDPKLSDIEAVCDVVLTAETIKAVLPVPEVKAVAAVKVRAAVKADAKKGIQAKTAVKASAAVKAVKAVKAARRVPGGQLEGGTII